jgi:gliding motility-associated protein GldM
VLKKKINDLKAKLTGLLDSSDRQTFTSDLEANDPTEGEEKWEEALFEHAPLAAVMAIMSKIQNDAKNSESDVLTKLARAITKSDQTFSNLDPKIIPSSTYVMLGQEFTADIFLAAYDAKVDNPVFVNGSSIKVENGMGKYKDHPSREGEIKYSGKIQVKDPTGKLVDYPFEGRYFAFKPAATISATKMNVLYVGVDNPISVSVPGVRPEDVSVSATSGTITGGKGEYKIRVSLGQKETTINASAKTSDGKTQSMGGMKYRIRPLPKPITQLGNLPGPTATTAALKATTVVYASLGEGFAFEGISFTVTEFKFIYVPKRGDARIVQVRGAFISPEARAIINKLVPGDQVIISDVKATGPAGPVTLNTSVVMGVR